LTKELHLFDGDQGPCLMERGLKGGTGQVYANPAALFTALRPRLMSHYINVCAPAP